MQRSAILSECGNFRFLLTRRLDRELWHEHILPGCVVWVLNNPSTADADKDDPTVRKCWAYTAKWGYGKMAFVNTNPYRSTDPKLARVPRSDILLANDSWLRYVMQEAPYPYVIAAWGDKAHPGLAKRAVEVIRRLAPLHAMRITKAGNPQHPLYLPGDLKPTLWRV